MHLNRSFCAFIIALPALSLRAQQPMLQWEDSPQWSVAWWILGMPIGTNAFTCTGQQALCGEVYNVVEGLQWSGPGYYRNEGQKTYVRSSTDCGIPERLMYDYGLSVGDSTYVGSYWGDTALAVLVSIDTIQTTGGSRRRFNLLIDYCPVPESEPFLFPMTWIDGIGSTAHPFYSLICICDFCEIGTALLCADSLGVPVYRTVPGVNCAQTIDVHEHDDARSELLVQRTEAGIEVVIPEDAKGGALSVLDATGRVLHERRISVGQRSVVLPNRVDGMLIVQLQSDDGRQWLAKLALSIR